MAKTMDQITAEYRQACAELGQAYYQVEVLNEQIDKLSNTLRNLNIDANKLQKQAEKQGAEVSLPETPAEGAPSEPTPVQN